METITNFRDLGGIQNKDGHRIRSKKLLRSGELSRVSIKEQIELLEVYQLGKIIDLRSEEEVTERPNKTFENTEYRHIDIFKNEKEEGSGLKNFKEITGAKQAQEYMNGIYHMMATNKGAQEGFGQMIEETLATVSSKNSVLFHCFAGKDRTGISAALLLEILNVSKDIIYADYMATNALRVKENDELIQRAHSEGLNVESIEAFKIALNVEKEYLDSFYRIVDKEFGSVEDFISTQLDITPSMQEDLRNLLLKK